MKALSAELPEQTDLQRRFYYEYIDALNQRNRSKEDVALLLNSSI